MQEKENCLNLEMTAFLNWRSLYIVSYDGTVYPNFIFLQSKN